jgi:hypothetical protein
LSFISRLEAVAIKNMEWALCAPKHIHGNPGQLFALFISGEEVCTTTMVRPEREITLFDLTRVQSTLFQVISQVVQRDF